MKYEILNRCTGEVQFVAEIECEETAPKSLKVGLSVKWGVKHSADLRSANLSNANLLNADLRNADLRSADLSNANLLNADLRNADLRNADLRNAHGVNKYIKCIQVDTYAISYTDTVMQIGCENHLISEWADFDDERIIEMDGKTALRFWRKYKTWIFNTIELCPALPTKQDDEVSR